MLTPSAGPFSCVMSSPEVVVRATPRIYEVMPNKLYCYWTLAMKRQPDLETHLRFGSCASPEHAGLPVLASVPGGSAIKSDPDTPTNTATGDSVVPPGYDEQAESSGTLETLGTRLA